MLSILTQFLSNRSQHVMVDGCRRKLVNVVSGVLQGSVLGPLLFLLYTFNFCLTHSLIFYTIYLKLIKGLEKYRALEESGGQARALARTCKSA